MRAALAVAGVYGYFLIFAQFSFVELLRGAGIAAEMEKALLGAMALAGIAAGFLTAWRGVSPNLARLALLMAAMAAGLSSWAGGIPGFMMVALVTGASLGVATVCLSALLPAWCGVLWVGVGTGLGYAACNLPVVFLQTPAGQAWIGAGLAVLGAVALPAETVWSHRSGPMVFPFWSALALFTALVWMDSAAFFIIQHSGDLKAGTWGEAMLWRNAAVHLALACVAGWWLARGGAKSLPGMAWALLAVAALTVNDDATRPIAGWFYPAGVSLYSAALVAWPGWFAGAASAKAAGWRAAWLFAIAGWFGSANGIGMAQTLERVPPLFVAGAGAVVLAAMFLAEMKRWRVAVAVAFVMFAGWMGGKGSVPSVSSAEERGRRVYVSEGCIHCHSQYVRPGTLDEHIWGPVRGMEEVLKGQPVLIGNRRQGPDLTYVGARRSEAWLKQHFIDPRAFAPDSPMPSYAHLFEDGRGDDLVRYLKLSGVSGTADVMARASAWKPDASGISNEGPALFSRHCAVCHGDDGHGGGFMAGKFQRPPANLVKGPFVWTTPGADLELRIARAIKFGITGSDMPGHETLSDDQVNALVDEVMKLRSSGGQNGP
jgi:cytochrome c oxidase cbb3-type subunit 2